MKTATLVCSSLTALAAVPALAQDISWATFSREDSRLVAPADVGLDDAEEKDYAWADLDQDGWIDLVIVRKEPFTVAGRERNALLMNEGGQLVDRTLEFASASDVPGDQGFLTPTDDRDVGIADVDGDGWLDIVTCTTLGRGLTKALSHPRIYRNLGRSQTTGAWLGFVHEDARFPLLPTAPSYCAVALGDVTGDGLPDMYFANYEQDASFETRDRLLINDGSGAFVDESELRMTSTMRDSGFGAAAAIVDFNLDGAADVLAVSGIGPGPIRSDVIYNDPNNEGFLNLLQQPYTGGTYHGAAGDLNRDGRPDLVLSDDGQDAFVINEGNDVFGRVQWSSPGRFTNDLGFASNSVIADLDGDGWNDVLICDVDVDFPTCFSRALVHHNLGGTIGGMVSFREELSGQWVGAQGLPALDAVHDIAAFDMDNDGDLDLVVGTCTGTEVHMNQRDQLGVDECEAAVPNSSGRPADVQAVGSPVAAHDDVTLRCVDLPPNVFGIFACSRDAGFLPGAGGGVGTLCIGGELGRYSRPGEVLASGAAGVFELAISLTDIPTPFGSTQAAAGDTWRFTCWFRDVVGGVPTSNFGDVAAVTFR